MAMISIKNLVAPAKNTIHLMTVLALVFAFGMWRWSGGEVRFTKTGRGAAVYKNDRETDFGIPERAVNVPRADKRDSAPKVITVPDRAADDLLDSILKNPSDSGNAAQRGDAAKKSRPNNSLADIERSLGINKK